MSDFVKTTNVTGPSSLQGVRHQLRYWGMGQNTGSGRQAPVHSKMAAHNLKAVQNLAELQRRASQIQVGAERTSIAVKEGMREDTQDLRDKQWEMQEPDFLDQAGRAIVGTVTTLRGVRGLAKKADAKGLVDFLDKIPLVGPSKESKKVTELHEKMSEMIEQGKTSQIEMMKQVADLYGDVVKDRVGLKSSLSKILSPEEIDNILPDVNVHEKLFGVYDEMFQLINGNNVGLAEGISASMSARRF